MYKDVFSKKYSLGTKFLFETVARPRRNDGAYQVSCGSLFLFIDRRQNRYVYCTMFRVKRAMRNKERKEGSYGNFASTQCYCNYDVRTSDKNGLSTVKCDDRASRDNNRDNNIRHRRGGMVEFSTCRE